MADEVKTVVRQGVVQDPSSPEPEVVTMPWWQIIGVRVLRVYLQSLAGFLTANVTGFTDVVLEATADVQLPAMAFWGKFVTAASLAVAPAVFTLIQNAVEILTAIDVRKPTLRA